MESVQTGVSNPRRTWQPLPLQEPVQETVDRTLEAITDDLIAYADRAEADWLRSGLDLAEGWSGVALSLAYVSHRRAEAAAAARRLLAMTADHATRHELGPGLFGGLSGVAWVLEHLSQRMGWEAELDLADFDEQILQLSMDATATLDAELENGWAGIAIYLLERPRTQTTQRALDAVASRLDPIVLDLGVAHGTPGIMAVLSRVHGSEQISAEAEKALRRGAKRLADQAHAEWGLPCRVDEEILAPGRLAWCSGDLGAAAALLSIPDAPTDPLGRLTAQTTARVLNRPMSSSRLLDAGLCHGAAGCVALFHRMGQSTGDDRFLHRAGAYLELLLTMRTDAGIGGFQSVRFAGEPRRPYRESTPGFLRGSSGIGLVLLSALEPVAPQWHRVLAASGGAHDL